MARNVELRGNKQRLVQENDIIILVTGLSGSGKSQFVNTLIGRERMVVGESLTSCTRAVDYEIIDSVPNPEFRGRRLIIVDTPGLNGNVVNDHKILRDIADWIETSGANKLYGIIYLYDIFQQRYTPIPKFVIAALRALFNNSEDTAKKIVLTTTKWKRVEPSEGESREREVKTTFWKDLIDNGSQVKRFRDSPNSAWETVNALLDAGENRGVDVRSRLPMIHANLGTGKQDIQVAIKSAHKELQEDDIVILITGLTGSGKSTFVNTLLGEKRMAIGETLAPCTTKIDYEIVDPVPTVHNIDLRGRRLVIVDTPGFNNKVVPDNKILRDVVEWVENSCVKEITGIIYLYDIFQDKYASISKVDLAALRSSFQGSDHALERVALVTTKWEKLENHTEGDARESDLKTAFWNDLLNSGSQIKRFDDSEHSAWEIVGSLLDNARKDPAFDVRPQLAKLRSNLGANKKSSVSTTNYVAILQSIFGMFSRGIREIYGDEHSLYR